MLGNAFLTRQPQQRALRIALVVLKCLGGEASGHLMQLNEVRPDRAIPRRNDLKRRVHRAGDLPQGRCPVPSGLLGQFVGREDDCDGVHE